MSRLLRLLVATALILNLGVPFSTVSRDSRVHSVKAAEFIAWAVPPQGLLFRQTSDHVSYLVRVQAATLLFILGSAHAAGIPFPRSTFAVPKSAASTPAPLKGAALVRDAQTKQHQLVAATTSLNSSVAALIIALRESTNEFQKSVRIDADLMQREPEIVDKIAKTLAVSAAADSTVSAPWLKPARDAWTVYDEMARVFLEAKQSAEQVQSLLKSRASRKVMADLAQTVKTANTQWASIQTTLSKDRLVPGAPAREIWWSQYFYLRARYAVGGEAFVERFEAQDIPLNMDQPQGPNRLVLVFSPVRYNLAQPKGVRESESVARDMSTFPDRRALVDALPSLSIVEFVSTLYDAPPSEGVVKETPPRNPQPASAAALTGLSGWIQNSEAAISLLNYARPLSTEHLAAEISQLDQSVPQSSGISITKSDVQLHLKLSLLVTENTLRLLGGSSDMPASVRQAAVHQALRDAWALQTHYPAADLLSNAREALSKGSDLSNRYVITTANRTGHESQLRLAGQAVMDVIGQFYQTASINPPKPQNTAPQRSTQPTQLPSPPKITTPSNATPKTAGPAVLAPKPLTPPVRVVGTPRLSAPSMPAAATPEPVESIPPAYSPPPVLELLQKSNSGKALLRAARPWTAPELAEELNQIYQSGPKKTGIAPSDSEIRLHLDLTQLMLKSMEDLLVFSLEAPTAARHRAALQQALASAWALEQLHLSDPKGFLARTKVALSRPDDLASRYRKALANRTGKESALELAGQTVRSAIEAGSNVSQKLPTAHGADPRSTLGPLLGFLWTLPLPFRRRLARAPSNTTFARAEARFLMGKDFLKYDRPRTWREFKAYARLMNYPVAPLLADLESFDIQSEPYKETVMALKLNHNLVTYSEIRDHYERFHQAGEDAKASDVRDILRMVRYNAVLFGGVGDGRWHMINSRTWPQRADATLMTIVFAALEFQKTQPNETFHIQDWAVSDSVTSLDLAEILKDVGVRFSIQAWDRAISLRVVKGKTTTFVFTGDGTLLQSYVPSTGKLWLRWTLADYYAQPWHWAWKRLIEWLGNIDLGQREAGWIARESLLFAAAKVSKTVSLLDPVSEEFAKKHPGLLVFKQGDIFDPPAVDGETDVIRTWGILNRDEYSYFKEATIQEVLATLALRQKLVQGGLVINGIFGTLADNAHLFLDVFQRRFKQLVLTRSEGYPSTQGWEGIPLVMDLPIVRPAWLKPGIFGSSRRDPTRRAA